MTVGLDRQWANINVSNHDLKMMGKDYHSNALNNKL